ncbi:MAG: DUF1667 domain-containing protein [Eubacteriaceae bacterium]|nr:DUF1667 domain-containing protein [Eubacteriaceae bacterium]MDD4508060.1 DUF1667 domain-containing protein [Eubacteriaceae bacterium]
MVKTERCKMCSKNCSIDVTVRNGQISAVHGKLCDKGKDYVNRELINPRSNIAGVVMVEGGTLPLASVRLTKAIPKDEIYKAKQIMFNVCVNAPVYVGQVVVKNLLGTGSDVVATKNIPVDLETCAGRLGS